MRKLLLCLAALAGFAALYSCDDVIDADKNVKTTPLGGEEAKYTKVLSDQEHGVIMPLAVENSWLYHVRYYENGQLSYERNDSIFVLDKIDVNGEEWFRVSNPFVRFDNHVIMTNTDVGLWLKCNQCDSFSVLHAQYPVATTPYSSGNRITNVLYYEGGEVRVSLDTLSMSGEWVKSQEIPGGIAYEYRSYYESNFFTGKRLYRKETYIPNIGMTHGVHYNGEGSIDMTYELVHRTNYENGGALIKDVCQSVYLYDFGELSPGSAKNIQMEVFSNNTTGSVTVNSVKFTSTTNEFFIDDTNLPIVVPANGSYVSIIRFRPQSEGEKEVTLEINTSAGVYLVKIKGKGI